MQGRLPKQVVEYGQLFDSVTLVVGTVLFREAAELVPKWWGITLAATVDGSTVVLTEMRLATQNPQQNVEALTQLLWKDEARLALLELAGLRGATSESARALCSEVAKTIPFQIAKPWILKRLTNPTRLADWRMARNPLAPFLSGEVLRRM